jgi:hypothetical protein
MTQTHDFAGERPIENYSASNYVPAAAPNDLIERGVHALHVLFQKHSTLATWCGSGA